MSAVLPKDQAWDMLIGVGLKHSLSTFEILMHFRDLVDIFNCYYLIFPLVSFLAVNMLDFAASFHVKNDQWTSEAMKQINITPAGAFFGIY